MRLLLAGPRRPNKKENHIHRGKKYQRKDHSKRQQKKFECCCRDIQEKEKLRAFRQVLVPQAC